MRRSLDGSIGMLEENVKKIVREMFKKYKKTLVARPNTIKIDLDRNLLYIPTPIIRKEFNHTQRAVFYSMNRKNGIFIKRTATENSSGHFHIAIFKLKEFLAYWGIPEDDVLDIQEV